MRRVDRRTNALPDRPTDRLTDTASYRGALSHLKMKILLSDRFTNVSCLFVEADSTKYTISLGIQADKSIVFIKLLSIDLVCLR